jgi:hypothetical protein
MLFLSRALNFVYFIYGSLLSLFCRTYRFHLSALASLPNAQFITCWLLLLQFIFFFTLPLVTKAFRNTAMAHAMQIP